MSQSDLTHESMSDSPSNRLYPSDLAAPFDGRRRCIRASVFQIQAN